MRRPDVGQGPGAGGAWNRGNFGKGLHPGCVVWAHDPSATNWNGPGQGHWWESSHTIQSAVDGMMSQAVERLSGETGDRRAWNALFRNFNRTHGGGNAGYKKGEKIAIEVNFVGCIFSEGNVDPKTYDLGGRRLDYMNTSPQMILALLRQLVKNAGVNQEDISVLRSQSPRRDSAACQPGRARALEQRAGQAVQPQSRQAGRNGVGAGGTAVRPLNGLQDAFAIKKGRSS